MRGVELKRRQKRAREAEREKAADVPQDGGPCVFPRRHPARAPHHRPPQRSPAHRRWQPCAVAPEVARSERRARPTAAAAAARVATRTRAAVRSTPSSSSSPAAAAAAARREPCPPPPRRARRHDAVGRQACTVRDGAAEAREALELRRALRAGRGGARSELRLSPSLRAGTSPALVRRCVCGKHFEVRVRRFDGGHYALVARRRHRARRARQRWRYVVLR